MPVRVLNVSMEQNNATMGVKPRNIIDTVVVDPDDVIEALRFNGRPPEYKIR